MNEIEQLKEEIRVLRSQLARCFRGETHEVRNELVMEAIQKQTEARLAMPQEDLKEYLESRYDV